MRKRQEAQLDRPPRRDVDWRLTNADRQFLRSCNIRPS